MFLVERSIRGNPPAFEGRFNGQALLIQLIDLDTLSGDDCPCIGHAIHTVSGIYHRLRTKFDIAGNKPLPSLLIGDDEKQIIFLSTETDAQAYFLHLHINLFTCMVVYSHPAPVVVTPIKPHLTLEALMVQ